MMHSHPSTSPAPAAPGSWLTPSAADRDRGVVTFPEGLPGFESCRGFVVVAAQATPFQWLSSVQGPPASFLTINPQRLVADYRDRLSQGELSRLAADATTPLLWLVTVSLEIDGTLTANLRAPIVINPDTMTGRQLLPHDSPYSLRHVIVPGSPE